MNNKAVANLVILIALVSSVMTMAYDSFNNGNLSYTAMFVIFTMMVLPAWLGFDIGRYIKEE